ncbi:hypothetical protein OUZ56_010637 [Daphnia magna]|uniref:Uncharacterized protein n=1 Tax=Daphnia magna TaxID=35525 RepID=A0ABR0AJ46_9CRUS|nr:hypothetical protein OUZ56_010637 [Daphnia magna]
MAAVRTGLTNSKPRTAPKSKTAKPNRRFGDFLPANRGSPRSKTIGAEPQTTAIRKRSKKFSQDKSKSTTTIPFVSSVDKLILESC